MTAEEYTERLNLIEADFAKTFNAAQKKVSLKYLNERADSEFSADCTALVKRLTRDMNPLRKDSKAAFAMHVRAGASLKTLCQHPLTTSKAIACKQRLSKLRQSLEIMLFRQYPTASLTIYY